MGGICARTWMYMHKRVHTSIFGAGGGVHMDMEHVVAWAYGVVLTLNISLHSYIQKSGMDIGWHNINPYTRSSTTSTYGHGHIHGLRGLCWRGISINMHQSKLVATHDIMFIHSQSNSCIPLLMLSFAKNHKYAHFDEIYTMLSMEGC